MNQKFSFCKGGIKSQTPDSDIEIENAFALINSDTYKDQICCTPILGQGL